MLLLHGFFAFGLVITVDATASSVSPVVIAVVMMDVLVLTPVLPSVPSSVGASLVVESLRVVSLVDVGDFASHVR